MTKKEWTIIGVFGAVVVVVFASMAFLILTMLTTQSPRQADQVAISTQTAASPIPIQKATDIPILLNTPQSTLTPKIPLTITPQPQPTLGDVAVKNGYSLSVSTIEDPVKQPSIIYKPEAGKKLVAIEIILDNISSKPLQVNPLDGTLVDNAGFSYKPELGGRNGQLDLVILNSGEKVRGWIAFKIPNSAVPKYIKYDISRYPTVSLQAPVTK